MKKQMKQQLETVFGALIEKDMTTAKTAFHDYLRLKSQQVLLGESVESEEDDKEDSDDKASDKTAKSDEEDCEM